MFNLANVFRKAKPGEPWPLRFDSYSFDARCYNTLRCSIIFDRQQHSLHVAEPAGQPYAENWKDGWTGGFGSTEEFERRGFPSLIDIRWAALDGVERELEIDLEEVFPGHVILHNVPRDEVEEDWAINSRKRADILLEVNNCTVNIYTSARVLTKLLRDRNDPDWKVSRDELVLAWTRTYPEGSPHG